jgi:hypothetical protein
VNLNMAFRGLHRAARTATGDTRRPFRLHSVGFLILADHLHTMRSPGHDAKPRQCMTDQAIFLSRRRQPPPWSREAQLAPSLIPRSGRCKGLWDRLIHGSVGHSGKDAYCSIPFLTMLSMRGQPMPTWIVESNARRAAPARISPKLAVERLSAMVSI